MDLVLGIDLGTSYFKLGLFDRAGRLAGLGRVAVEPDRGDGGRCELSTDRFWALLRRGLGEALAAAGANAEDVRAVSYGSQANSFVLLDADDEPLTPLVLWPDGRAANEPNNETAALSGRADFLATTGLGLFGHGFAIAKLRWFQRHQPAIWRRVARVQTISDHLVFGLTGERFGDAGTAALLGLYDLPGGGWWPVGLVAAGLDPAMLSTPLPPGGEVGVTTVGAANRMGLPAGIPVAAGSLDHHAAALGAGVGTLASLSESTGTVLACLRYTDDYRPQPGCCMGPTGLAAPRFYQLAFDDNGAAALDRYQQTSAPTLTITELLALAAGTPSAGGHGSSVRAILDSTAATLARLVDTLCPTGRPDRIVATGGAARSDLWLQIKANTVGTTLIAPTCPEPATRGAAILATVAAGWFDSVAAAAGEWVTAGDLVRTFRPRSMGVSS